MAQLAAVRVHCDRRAIDTIALHPQGHLLVSENDSLRRLHRLQALPLGERHRLYQVDDLAAVRERIGAVLLELPERNIGGARLWESQPHYGRPLSELTRPFDTVYVSFYKVLGAIAGAALAGPKDVIDEARGWQWRQGGRLYQQFPYVVAARQALRERLPRVPQYCARARDVAAILSRFDDVEITPDPPSTNMMHVYVRGDRERLEQAALRVSSESGVWLPSRWNATQIPGWAMFERKLAVDRR